MSTNPMDIATVDDDLADALSNLTETFWTPGCSQTTAVNSHCCDLDSIPLGMTSPPNEDIFPSTTFPDLPLAFNLPPISSNPHQISVQDSTDFNALWDAFISVSPASPQPRTYPLLSPLNTPKSDSIYSQGSSQTTHIFSSSSAASSSRPHTPFSALVSPSPSVLPQSDPWAINGKDTPSQQSRKAWRARSSYPGEAVMQSGRSSPQPKPAKPRTIPAPRPSAACHCPDKTAKPARHWRTACPYNPSRTASIMCDICGSRFSRKDNFERHRRSNHF